MLRKILFSAVFAATFVLAQAHAAPPKQGQRVNPPSAPQPKGFCWPSGMPC